MFYVVKFFAKKSIHYYVTKNNNPQQPSRSVSMRELHSVGWHNPLLYGIVSCDIDVEVVICLFAERNQPTEGPLS